MGLRFRKSINLGGGVRVNLSKRGVGVSAGVKGARVGVGPRGVRTTTSIPGTGVSYVKERRIGANKFTPRSNYGNVSSQTTSDGLPSIPKQEVKNSKWIFGVILGFIMLIGNPLLGVPLLIISLYFTYKHTQSGGYKSKANYNMAVKFIEKKEYDKGIEKLEIALTFDESNVGAHFLLSFTLHDYKKDYEKAIMSAQRVFQADGVSLELIIATKFIAGNSYFELKKFDEAIMILQGIKEELPEEIEYEKYLLIGRSFFEKGQYELAIEQFKKGPILKRTLTPHVMEFKYWLGLCYIKTGDVKKAKTQLSKVYAEDMQYRQIKSYMDDLLDE